MSRSRSNLAAALTLASVLSVGLLAGCAANREHLDEALLADRGAGQRNQKVAEQYAVRCPDVLEVAIAGRVAQPVRCTVGLDGRIDLGHLGQVRVEGQPMPEIARTLAHWTEVPPEAVQVRVAEFRSQRIYLCGEGNGFQRAVPYEGPETVLDLLHRVGGIKPGAEPGNVHVIRSGIAEDQPPEVFHVDLQAVILKRDQRTNVRLQPYDQVYVGETKESSLRKCFPLWLRPLYDRVWGLWRPGGVTR